MSRLAADASGTATLTIINGAMATQTATATVATVAPTLFSVNGTGIGVAAASAIVTPTADPRVQSPVPVFQCSESGCVSVPISLSADTVTYVTFYGTGIRNRSSLANVIATIHGIPAPVSYAGPTPNFNGLDQVNVRLISSLQGTGESKIILTVDGQTSNAVTIRIQ